MQTKAGILGEVFTLLSSLFRNKRYTWPIVYKDMKDRCLFTVHCDANKFMAAASSVAERTGGVADDTLQGPPLALNVPAQVLSVAVCSCLLKCGRPCTVLDNCSWQAKHFAWLNNASLEEYLLSKI